MTGFRKGDKVKFEFVVERVHNGHVYSKSGYMFGPDALELVERPGPRLEDLPDGTVILVDNEYRREVLFKYGNGLTVITDIDREHGYMIATFTWPFEVIGACPGTPAWPIWMAHSGADDKSFHIHENEWWRSE